LGIALLKKIIALFISVPLLLYGSACGWLYFSQQSMLYFPTPAFAVADALPLRVQRNDVHLKGWVVNPNKPHALLYFGGNGEAIEQSADFFRSTMPNTTVYLLPYRGYGGNPGEPSQAVLFSDALALYDQVSPHHIRLRAMGRSLGSGVASYLAAERNIDKLILVTPYDSVLNVASSRYPMFPIQWLLKDPYESWRISPKITAQVLVLIAEKDETIPRARTDNLLKHFTLTPKVLVFADAGHVTISDDEKYNGAVSEFIEE
jgi:uncharacterized protein